MNRMFKDIAEIITQAQNTPPLRLAVAAAGDTLVLKSVRKAAELGIIEPILIGNQERIKQALAEIDYNFQGEIIPTGSASGSAHQTMELIRDGQADLPMKGQLSTKEILKAMLAQEYGLKTGSLLSLVTVLSLADNRLVVLTDGGMNIAPDLQEKIQILNNAIVITRALGIDRPKVAPLAAVETVNPAMPATVEAAVLSKMAERGQIKGAIIDGPLALDNALSIESARQKGIGGSVAGKADILLVPDIEAGNILYKALVTCCGLGAASLVYGARVPLVLTSRSDQPEVKLASIALAKVVVSYLAAKK